MNFQKNGSAGASLLQQNSGNNSLRVCSLSHVKINVRVKSAGASVSEA